MEWLLGVFLAALLVFVVVAGLVWRPIRTAWRDARFAEACRAFHRQRERLEAKFVQLRIGKPDGPRWIDSQFDDDVAYARNRSTGELSAFVAATIGMDNFDGGTLDNPDRVGTDAATAVFRFDGNHWETDGRAIFNVTPTEAIRLYRRHLEMVGHEVAQRS